MKQLQLHREVVNKEFKVDHRWLYKIACKLPPIWKGNIRLWFTQVECSFELSEVTRYSTKYNHLVAVIDPETLTAVSDILLNPPATEKYEALKRRLIAEFSDSENARVKKLLSDVNLGDEKPSHLLRRMRDLAGQSVKDDFLKNLWSQRLPVDIQTILSVSSEPLDNLARLADTIAEVNSNPSHSGVFAASSDPVSRETKKSTPKDDSSLRSEIAALRREVERLSRSHSRSRRGRVNRSPHHRKNSRGRYCYYHTKFGKEARKCQGQCDFKDQEN